VSEETIIAEIRPHWSFFVRSFVRAVAIGVVATVCFVLSGRKLHQVGRASSSLPLERITQIVRPALVVFAVGGVVLLVGIRWAQFRTIQVTLTSTRVITRYGVLTRSGKEIPVTKITDVGFRQTLFERIVKTGTVTVESGGEQSQLRFPYVPKPQEFVSLIHRAKEAVEQAIHPGQGLGLAILHLTNRYDTGEINRATFDAVINQLTLGTPSLDDK
jgi:uncharacterized membrane protein YdbT with pleckstrin-like domain